MCFCLRFSVVEREKGLIWVFGIGGNGSGLKSQFISIYYVVFILACRL